MKKTTDAQAKKATEGLMGFHRPLQFMLKEILGDQYDSVTIVCALKSEARSKNHPAIAAVCGTFKFENTLVALKASIKSIAKLEKK